MKKPSMRFSIRRMEPAGSRMLRALVLGMTLGCAFAAQATDYTWLPTAGNTSATAYEWDNPDNWKDGNVPKGADVSCTMKGEAFSSAGSMYVKFPDAGLALADFRTQSNSKRSFYFVGGKLTLANASGTSYLTGSWNTGTYPHFYVPVEVVGDLYLSEQYRGKFYRPVTVSGDVYLHNAFQMNLTETATASGIYTNAFPTGTYACPDTNPVFNFLSSGSRRYRQEIAWVKCDYFTQLQSKTAWNDDDAGDTGAMIDVDIAKLTGSANLKLAMDGHVDNQCGRVFLHDVTGFTGAIQTQQGRLWLYRDNGGNDPSLKSLTILKDENCNTRVRVCVPEADVTATIDTLTYPDPYNANRTADLVKIGPGRLVVSNFTTTATRSRITVKEGTLMFAGGSGTVNVPKLGIKDGATLEIPEGVTINVGEAAFTGHITVKGPGTLNVTAYSAETSITKLTYENGAKYTPGYNETDLVRRQVVPEVRGTPALWLDANDLVMGVTDVHGETTAGGYVVRWTDTRAKTGEEGYFSATNSNTSYPSYRPTLKRANVTAGGFSVSMDRNFSATSYSQTGAMFWTKPLTNITHVFMVADPQLGGGHFLGTSSRLVDLGLVQKDITKEPFYRGHLDWNDNGNFIYSGNIWTACKNGTWRNNGLKVDPTASSAWGGQNGGKMIEFHPAGTVPADSFSATTTANGSNGRSIVSEVLIYTNALSDLECRCISAYLMKKWLERDYVRSDDTLLFPQVMEGEGVVSIGEGVTLGLDSWSAYGTVRKEGAGTLEISALEVPEGGIVVKGGTVKVFNDVITSEDELPADPVLHLDATKERFDTYRTSGGTNFIGRWKDVRDDAPYEARCRSSAKSVLPWIRENALNGLPMLDMGPLGPETYDANKRMVFQMMKAPTTSYSTDTAYQPLPNAATTFQILGSEYGGNTIFAGDSAATATFDANNIAPRTHTDPTAAVVNSRTCTMAARGRFSLNGREYGDPTVAYLSGAFDLVSWRQNGTDPSGVYISSIGFSGNMAYRSGGQLLGEVLVYTNQLSMTMYRRVQSFLHKKWFGDYLDGNRPSEMSALSVDAGADFKVDGGRTTVMTIGGGGTVSEGELRLSADGTIELYVNEDGTLAPLTIGNDATLAVLGGGTVRLTGHVDKLGVASSGVILGNVTYFPNVDWTIENAPKKRVCALQMVDGKLVFTSNKRGLVMIIR